MANYYDFPAVQRYTIAQGALKEIRRLTRGLGNRYLIITEGRRNTERYRKEITDSFNSPIIDVDDIREELGRVGLANSLSKPDSDKVEIEYEFYDLPGKVCSEKNIRTAANKITKYSPDVIVAVGGSKCMDIVRAATHYINMYSRPNLVICPTVAASNASATGVSIIYNDEGTKILDFWSLAMMPECVILDTDIIIDTPVNTLVAGIGDQLSSSIEAIHTLKKTGAYETCDRMCIAHHEAVIDVLTKYSRSAVQAMKRREITPEFEWVCHSITRYTGPQTAVATAFLSHVLDEALIEFPAVASKMHGLIVGYGVLPEMVAFGTPDEIYPLVDLYRDIGIPVNLKELGIPGCTYEQIYKACETASDKIMASLSIYKWSPREMAAAVMEADRLVNEYLIDCSRCPEGAGAY